MSVLRLLIVRGGNLPTGEEHLDTLRVVCLDEDDGTAYIVQHSPQAFLGRRLEAVAELDGEEIHDGIAEDDDARNSDFKVQVAESEGLDLDLQALWVLEKTDEICEAIHEAHRLHCPRSHEERLQRRGRLEERSVDRLPSCLARFGGRDEELPGALGGRDHRLVENELGEIGRVHVEARLAACLGVCRCIGFGIGRYLDLLDCCLLLTFSLRLALLDFFLFDCSFTRLCLLLGAVNAHFFFL